MARVFNVSLGLLSSATCTHGPNGVLQCLLASDWTPVVNVLSLRFHSLHPWLGSYLARLWQSAPLHAPWLSWLPKMAVHFSMPSPVLSLFKSGTLFCECVLWWRLCSDQCLSLYTVAAAHQILCPQAQFWLWTGNPCTCLSFYLEPSMLSCHSCSLRLLQYRT